MTTLDALRDCEYIGWSRNDYGSWEAVALENRAVANEWVAGSHPDEWFITSRALSIFIEAAS